MSRRGPARLATPADVFVTRSRGAVRPGPRNVRLRVRWDESVARDEGAVRRVPSSTRSASRTRRPGPRTRSGGAGEEDLVVGVLKKALLWLLLAFLVYYLVTKPEASAAAVTGAIDGIHRLFLAFGRFFSALAS